MKSLPLLIAGGIAITAALVGTAIAVSSMQKDSIASSTSPSSAMFSSSSPRSSPASSPNSSPNHSQNSSTEPSPALTNPVTQASPASTPADQWYHPLPNLDQVPPDFATFRDQLRQAIRDRDANFIRSIAAPGIRLSFGPPQSIDELPLDDPNSPLWASMEKTFSVGCVPSSQITDRPVIVCPFIFEVWSQYFTADRNEVAILGEFVNVRSQPSLDSPVVDVLNHEAAPLGEPGNVNQVDGWTQIILPDRSVGYVSNRYVFHELGYRAYFEKMNGEWKMTVFVSGD